MIIKESPLDGMNIGTVATVAIRELPGLNTIDLIGPKDWEPLKKMGINVGIANGAEIGLNDGWNHLDNHEQLIKNYKDLIPKLAESGNSNLICFYNNFLYFFNNII